jgi:hypothetical protein
MTRPEGQALKRFNRGGAESAEKNFLREDPEKIAPKALLKKVLPLRH